MAFFPSWVNQSEVMLRYQNDGSPSTQVNAAKSFEILFLNHLCSHLLEDASINVGSDEQGQEARIFCFVFFNFP